MLVGLITMGKVEVGMIIGLFFVPWQDVDKIMINNNDRCIEIRYLIISDSVVGVNY
jgi:hypothetical protein